LAASPSKDLENPSFGRGSPFFRPVCSKAH
jgi:hypothetical protein